MANVTYQIDGNTNQSVPQTSTDGAADVNIASGAVGIDPGQNTVSIGTKASSADAAIGTGGAAQVLFSNQIPTNGWAIYNPDAANDLWVSDSTTAAANGQGSIRVAANGGGYETPPGYKPNHTVSIIGAVTGQKITARQW